MAGETWSVEMFPKEETSVSHDLTVDDACSTLRVTAEMFERSAAATDDSEKREALLHYAKCYREMAELRDQSDAEMDDESA
jgi:hypothetical protein